MRRVSAGPNFLAMLALVALAAPSAAQSPAAFTRLPATPAVSLERLEVSLWPEYDRLAMLVLYRATLPPQSKLPATVMLPIPERPLRLERVAPARDEWAVKYKLFSALGTKTSSPFHLGTFL